MSFCMYFGVFQSNFEPILNMSRVLCEYLLKIDSGFDSYN